ncbi:MAG: hypothetical protein ACFFCO_10195 [Promethearchaeota archaeon]
MGPEGSPRDKIVQEQICVLLNRYITLLGKYEQVKAKIRDESQTQIATYLANQGIRRVLILEDSQIIHNVDEFVDHLVIYYSYYRSQRRSFHTLFSSVGITDTKVFDELVRSTSSPRPLIQSKELDVTGIRWFLYQFLEDLGVSAKYEQTLIKYLPLLEEVYKVIQSTFMHGFLDVLRYMASEKAEQLRSKGYTAVNAAIKEENLEEVLNYVSEAISAFATYSREFPAFILINTPSLFGRAEMESFDKKIQEFQKIRQQFKEHASLFDRTRWIFEEHHRLLFRSLVDLSHIQMVELMHKIRAGQDIRILVPHLRDYKTMLLGTSQALSLYLEYSAYKDLMIKLVKSYDHIAKFLKSGLLEILYKTEIKRNELFLSIRKDFKEVLDQIQETLLKVTSVRIEDSETQGSVL